MNNDKDEPLTIEQTRTGYWSVQRGKLQLASAATRKGAEAERELLSRLSARRVRRSAKRSPQPQQLARR